jgi:hypothetical protein
MTTGFGKLRTGTDACPKDKRTNTGFQFSGWSFCSAHTLYFVTFFDDFCLFQSYQPPDSSFLTSSGKAVFYGFCDKFQGVDVAQSGPEEYRSSVTSYSQRNHRRLRLMSLSCIVAFGEQVRGQLLSRRHASCCYC